MRGRGMAAGYSQWLCFIPVAKIGPVPVYDTFLEKDLLALLDRVRISRSFRRTFSTRKTCFFAQNINVYHLLWLREQFAINQILF